MRTIPEYVHVAVKALTLPYASEEQVDAENEFYELLRKDGLNSPVMEDLKASVLDRVTEGLILRTNSDFAHRRRK